MDVWRGIALCIAALEGGWEALAARLESADVGKHVTDIIRAPPFLSIVFVCGSNELRRELALNALRNSRVTSSTRARDAFVGLEVSGPEDARIMNPAAKPSE